MQSTIPLNLQTEPLLISTNSTLGSDDEVNIFLLDSQGDLVGEIGIIFSSEPQYFLDWCTYPARFDRKLPAAVYKTWRVTVDRTNDIRVIIHCNGVKVVDTIISEETCSFRVWKHHWTNAVEKIFFPSHDDASDYYKSNLTGMLFSILRFQY